MDERGQGKGGKKGKPEAGKREKGKLSMEGRREGREGEREGRRERWMERKRDGERERARGG